VWKAPAAVQWFWESASVPRRIVPAGVLQPPLWAEDPRPREGAMEVVQNTTLRWKAGARAIHHDLYLGDDPNAVAQATPASAGIYRGRQSADVTAFHTGPLKWGRTYYWRLDEVNDAEPSSPWRGPLWSFTAAADYIPVDDFESYTDQEGERLYETWIDGWDNGTGSVVGYLTVPPFPMKPIAHQGVQAMPFDYNNANPPYYSEAYRTWDVPQDWTVNGVTELSLWLLGRPPSILERSDGVIIVTGTGYDDTGTNDMCQFAYRRLSGDGEIVARIDNLTNAKGWARAGVMMREHLGYGASYAAVAVTADHGVSFSRFWGQTLTKGAQTNHPGPQAPHWVKLTRRGNAFTAQHSPDGVSWWDVTDADGKTVLPIITMPRDIYIGLCVMSYSWSTTVAEFSAVNLAGNVSGQWQIGGNGPGNSHENLYVSLEDSAGRSAVVVNPDPGAVNLTAWTQWRIPLSRFTDFGVDAKAVQRIYLAVGDRNRPQPGGSGMIWIDDIHVIRSVPPGPPTVPGQAVAVYPGSGALDTPQSVELHWLSGEEAQWHDIYFGDDAEVVANATPAGAGIYRGRQKLEETRYHPGLLDWNKSYFWRIDEVNDSHPAGPWKGHVWSFTTADFLVIDDFESYTDEDGYRLYETWVEGWMNVTTLPGLPVDDTLTERTVVHRGRQAMSLTYDNVRAPWYYEVEREFAAWEGLRDWTVNGIDTLALDVRGIETNHLQPLYVAVRDTVFKSALVTHPDPRIVQATEWAEWKIPLRSFAGVNLAKVRTITFGVGDRANPGPGGTGTIYVDDIRVGRSTAHQHVSRDGQPASRRE